MVTLAVRQVSLYCLVLFNDKTGNSTVFTYKDSQSLLDAFLEISPNTNLFPYTFCKHLYVTQGHPLFDIAEPVGVSHSTVKIKY